MKKTFLLLSLFISIAVSLAAEGRHLFILSGQSNMAGMDPDQSFTPAVEKEFGKENVTVVKVAKGGAPIRGWYKNYQFPGRRNLTARQKADFGKIYDKLMEAVEAATSGKSYDSVTFVWMQGERDARLSLSEVYEASFKGILDQLKDDLALNEINFVIGRISDFDMQNERYPHWTKIRDIQVKMADKAPNGTWVDTDDLNGGKPGKVGGGLHYNESGYATLGQRFAESAIELIKQ